MKLHELLKAALDDFDIIQNEPGFGIEMNSWMRTDGGGTCHVCLAGAYLHRTLGLQKPSDGQFYTDNYDMIPDGLVRHLPSSFKPVARILDQLARGRIMAAYFRVGTDFRPDLADKLVTPYSHSPTQWRIDMDNVLAYLQEKDI